ncbi:hypothetical protein J6590_088288 [Homalodisca vitripennis]|nr:hypothetical protein J6590_085752 [Homalodisca vitripennis]KAG8304663.1 hypothetical protein J6590_088288 [Homalodisca vitripennis]
MLAREAGLHRVVAGGDPAEGHSCNIITYCCFSAVPGGTRLLPPTQDGVTWHFLPNLADHLHSQSCMSHTNWTGRRGASFTSRWPRLSNRKLSNVWIQYIDLQCFERFSL